MPEEKKDEHAVVPTSSSLSVRIFSLPQEFRDKSARLGPEAQESSVLSEPVDPILIPMPFPVSQEALPEHSVSHKQAGSTRVLLSILLVVVLLGGGFGAWWYVTRLQAPEQPVSTPPVVTPPVVVDSNPDPTEPYPGTDTDSDGLTNKEELLYGTDFRAPDTDGDTFLDGNEVFHRYDPNGLAPSTLLDTGSVRVLEREEMPFTVFYPASWDVSVLVESARVSFRSSSTASVVLRWEAKDALVPLEDWFDEQDISLSSTEPSMTKEGYMARSTNDGRTSYVDTGAWVIVAEYDVGDAMSIDFLQTFAMMINSVVLSEETP